LALVKAAQGNVSEAMIWIEKAIQLKPNDAFFRNNRGYIFIQMNELDKALEDINYSIASDPNNAWAYRNKGLYYLKQNDATNAIRLLAQALKIDAFIEDGQFYLAEAYRISGDLESACKSFNEAMALGQADETSRKLYCK
jgi:tetratricopeptide (TPR) repeat protein